MRIRGRAAKIERKRGVMGGSPVIAGTRVRVSDVVRYREVWPDDSVNRIVDALPDLTTTQVNAALEYYDSHKAEIDEEIKVEGELAEKWRPRRAST